AAPLGLVVTERGEGRSEEIEGALHALRKRASSMRNHPLDAALELGARRAAPEMRGPPVPRQDPFEVVVEQALHRGDLLRPRVPAGAAERVEVAAALAPGEVIAGEEERVAVEEHGVALRVARRRNHDEVGSELDRIEAGGLPLHAGRARADVVAVEHALASKVLMELLVIGDVVLV